MQKIIKTLQLQMIWKKEFLLIMLPGHGFHHQLLYV